MKSLVRWGTTLGLVGSTVLATVLSGNISAFALSEQQIKEKLDAVPVWMITNPQGVPISRPLPTTDNNGKKIPGGSLMNVFMSKTEAQASIKQLQAAKNPDPKMAEMFKTLQPTAFPLGSIYQLSQQSKKQSERILFAFKPVDQDIKGAVDLLRASGQNVKQFPSVPVFMVRFAPDKPYVPIQLGSDKKDYIPLFMSKQDALTLLNQVKPQFPKADIQVVDVDGVLKTMQDKNDKWLEQVVFFPSPEAREYIRTLSSNNPQQKPNQQPANRPAPKK